MFANVFLMHDCQHPCVKTAEAGKDLGKLSWPISALAADPVQGWHCPSSQLCNLQTCGNIVPGSRMLACWLVKLFYFTSLSPSSLFGDTWCWIFAKSGEFSDHLLVFCFCPIWCEERRGCDHFIVTQARPPLVTAGACSMVQVTTITLLTSFLLTSDFWHPSTLMILKIPKKDEDDLVLPEVWWDWAVTGII